MSNKSILESLSLAYALNSKALEKANVKIKTLEEEVAFLKEQLQLQKLGRFGKKSEADGSIDENQNTSESSVVQTIASYTRRKKKLGRTLDTSTLPRHRMVHDLADNEKTCTCCSQSLHYIGKDVSEQLEVIPSRYCVIEHIRMKYGCWQCKRIIMAPKPPAPIPKCIAGASVLTDIILDKYQYHLPLYRQSKIMASYAMMISDNTLSNWVMQSGLGLLKLYDALWMTLLKNPYLQVDETPVKLLKPDKKGYLWTYFTPLLGNGLVAFEMSESRTGKIAEKKLASFNNSMDPTCFNTASE